ncbi:hypothetical protein, partial [uncultured Helicobacter sp.]|uniref:hypothetical protein n=1 Tax=uncultured Helicobacter sp. TaxID=175537 RepID=UPI00263676AF
MKYATSLLLGAKVRRLARVHAAQKHIESARQRRFTNILSYSIVANIARSLIFLCLYIWFLLTDFISPSVS